MVFTIGVGWDFDPESAVYLKCKYGWYMVRGTVDPRISGAQSTSDHADYLRVHINLHLVPCGPQDEPTCAIHAGICQPAANLGVRCRRYRCSVGFVVQLPLHLSLRPHLAAVDHRACRTLYGSDSSLVSRPATRLEQDRSDNDSRKCLILTNLVTDLIIVVLPIRSVWQLQMRKTEKFAVLACFGLGGACIIISLARFSECPLEYSS